MKAAVWLLLLAAFAAAQDKPHPGVDQKRVDAAIDRGAVWLLKQKYDPWKFHDIGIMRHHELVLYTLLHAGTDREDPVFQKLLKTVLESELEKTYMVSLQAMLLSELDPAKYQWRIAQCGQFLVDNQCGNGQWGYGTPTTYPKDVPTSGTAREDVATGGVRTRKPATKIKLKRQRDGGNAGDNSNSQYAALGLRACLEANVIPPGDVLDRAKKWWEKSQNKDGGWGYGGRGGGSYFSMTAGATGSLVLLKHYLGEKWMEDPAVVRGTWWMRDHFTVKENAGSGEPNVWTFYALYALERAGIFTQLEKFGAHDWYREGANHLLDIQKDDGSWTEGNTWGGPIKDTCFAILFLRRATIPLPKVATGK